MEPEDDDFPKSTYKPAGRSLASSPTVLDLQCLSPTVRRWSLSSARYLQAGEGGWTLRTTWFPRCLYFFEALYALHVYSNQICCTIWLPKFMLLSLSFFLVTSRRRHLASFSSMRLMPSADSEGLVWAVAMMSVSRLWIRNLSATKNSCDPVDGRNPANQLRLVGYHIINKVLYIPSGAGFLNHQQSQGLCQTAIPFFW